MIRFDSVTKRYADGTVAVSGLSLEAASGEITVLVGPSGSGKTTTLRMINRLTDPPRAGSGWTIGISPRSGQPSCAEAWAM